MFPSDLTSLEPRWQRLALLVVADVVMLRNSPDELLPDPSPARSPIAFLPAVFSPTLFFPALLLSRLPIPAPQVLKSGLSDGVGA
jgi:hypothetical protein